MNVNIENQENFAKKKKIIVISLSAALVFITLIAGLFLAKKNKESNHENSDIGEVVNENNSDHENNDDNDHENDSVIVNEGDYFFNKTSGQITTNILLSIVTGILFFFWENDKLPEDQTAILWEECNKNFLLCDDLNAYCGRKEKKEAIDIGYGIFEKLNWFGFASLGFLIAITFLVELILQLLIGSLAHLFSKDKNKRYFRTLKMSLEKRKQIFFSFSKTKIFFIALTYLLCGFVIAILARATGKKLCCYGNGGIIPGHNVNYFLCCCKSEYKSQKDKIEELMETIDNYHSGKKMRSQRNENTKKN